VAGIEFAKWGKRFPSRALERRYGWLRHPERDRYCRSWEKDYLVEVWKGRTPK